MHEPADGQKEGGHVDQSFDCPRDCTSATRAAVSTYAIPRGAWNCGRQVVASQQVLHKPPSLGQARYDTQAFHRTGRERSRPVAL